MCKTVYHQGMVLTGLFSHEATTEIWQEACLSALLRAILYADDPNYRLMGYRKLDPITSPEAELRFLQAAAAVFSKGRMAPVYLCDFFNPFFVRLATRI